MHKMKIPQVFTLILDYLYITAIKLILNNAKTPNFTFLGVKLVFISQFADFQHLLRRDRDSNPGYLAVQRFSRPPQSTTLPPLQDSFSEVLSVESAAKVQLYFK